jgi:hypothetical protein
MPQPPDVDSIAAAIGEVGMAWGHTERALLHCRRSGRPDVSNLAISLAQLADELEKIEVSLRRLYREAEPAPK